MSYIATFYTHLGAMLFAERLQGLGDQDCQMMPVPRKLSVSCGTGVRFSLPFEAETMVLEDLEAVFCQDEAGACECIWRDEH